MLPRQHPLGHLVVGWYLPYAPTYHHIIPTMVKEAMGSDQTTIEKESKADTHMHLFSAIFFTPYIVNENQ